MSTECVLHRRVHRRNGGYKLRTVHYISTIVQHKRIQQWVSDYGTLRSMYKKYGDKFEYYCADLPPTLDGSGYCLRGSSLDNEQTDYRMKRYSRHKAWIQYGLRVNGKPVILVSHAAEDSHKGLHTLAGDGEPAMPEKEVYMTWGIFKGPDGIPFLGLIQVVNGQPVLNKVMRLTMDLEEFEKLYTALKAAMEGPAKRPAYLG